MLMTVYENFLIRLLKRNWSERSHIFWRKMQNLKKMALNISILRPLINYKKTRFKIFITMKVFNFYIEGSLLI